MQLYHRLQNMPKLVNLVTHLNKVHSKFLRVSRSMLRVQLKRLPLMSQPVLEMCLWKLKCPDLNFWRLLKRMELKHLLETMLLLLLWKSLCFLVPLETGVRVSEAPL